MRRLRPTTRQPPWRPRRLPMTGLALMVPIITLGACAQAPLTFIPAGLRATVEQEDRQGDRDKGTTVEAMLARARGEGDTAPESAAKPGGDGQADPQAVLAKARAWMATARPPQGGADVAAAPPSTPPRNRPEPAPPARLGTVASTMASSTVTLRFVGVNADPSPVDGLRLQVAVARLPARVNRATLRFAPAGGGDAFSALALGRRRVEAVRSLLPSGMTVGEAVYAPDDEPGTVTVNFAAAGESRG